MSSTIDSLKFRISAFSNARDNQPAVIEMTLPRLAEAFRAPELVDGCLELSASELKRLKESGDAWSPSVYLDNARADANVIEASFFVLDFDVDPDGIKGLTAESAERLFNFLDAKNLSYLSHSSFSAGFVHPRTKLRVVLPLKRPVTPAEYLTLWDQWVKELPVKPDPSRRHPGGIFFSARIPREHEKFYEARVFLDRPLLSPTTTTSLYSRDKFDRGGPIDWVESVRVAHNKHEALNKAAFALAAARLRAHQSTDDLWEILEAALKANTVSEPVADWGAAQKTVERAIRDAAKEVETETTPDPLVSDELIEPSPKQLEKAQKALKEQCKRVTNDTRDLSKAAFIVGTHVPAIDPELALAALVHAATDPKARPVMTASEAQPVASTGLAAGRAKSRFSRAGWQKKLLYSANGEGFSASDENCKLLLTHHPDMAGVVGLNERTGAYTLLRTPPWRHEGENFPCEINEASAHDIALWLSEQLKVPSVGADRALKAVISAAAENGFEPFRDWLNTLVWDRVPRIEFWLRDYASAEDSDYLRAVSKKFLISSVARTFIPGEKIDTTPILTGAQGVGKSRLVKSLLPFPELFGDHLGDIKNQDTLLRLEQCAIVEAAELAQLRGKAAEEVKHFLSGGSERIRPSYARLLRVVRRRAVIVGTTNETEFLVDPTGNRRFWPVFVGECFPEKLAKVREQLWAEAVHYYRSGETHWLSEDEKKLAVIEQERVTQCDPVEESLLAALSRVWVGADYSEMTEDGKETDPEVVNFYKEQLDQDCRLRWVTLSQACDIAGLDKTEIRDTMRVRGILVKNGYKTDRVRVAGNQFRVWTRTKIAQ